MFLSMESVKNLCLVEKQSLYIFYTPNNSSWKMIILSNSLQLCLLRRILRFHLKM